MEKYYQEAVSEMKKHEYVRTIMAINIFSTRDGLENYKDVPQLLKQCESVLTEQKYIAAIDLMNQGTYESAVKFFGELGEYKDSRMFNLIIKIDQLHDQEYNKTYVK